MWQPRPLFVSSTFLDMQAERDYLRDRVFPEIEELLRRRHHYLEWVDLRVGVPTAEEKDEAARELKGPDHLPCRGGSLPPLSDRAAGRPLRLGAAGGSDGCRRDRGGLRRGYRRPQRDRA